MAIKQDPNDRGAYIVSYSKRHPVSRQPVGLRRKGVKSLAEAKRVYNNLVVDVEERIRAKQIPAWRDVVGRFLAERRDRGLSGKTIEDYGLCLRAHTYDEWGSRLVDSITIQEVRDLHFRKSTARSISQQKSLLKMIRGVFSFAVENGFIDRNPTPALSFKTGDKIRRVLTEPQAKLLLDRAKEMSADWYPHWVMAIYTGMRNGELYALTWDKVNFDTQQVIVDCSWNCVDGFKSTKSGDDRVVDIAPSLMILLKRWKLERSDSAFVLPRLDKWEIGEQARELRMFLMGIGLQPVRFHDLRATWATMMLSKGVEPIKVMSMGGWKDIKTMMIYARKAGVDIRGVSAVLSDLHNPSIERAKVFQIGVCSDS